MLQKMQLCNSFSSSTKFSVVFLYGCIISSPMQFPRASWMKPAPHLTFGRQRNDPCVFWHSNSWPQLWIPVSHSSISGWRSHIIIIVQHTIVILRKQIYIFSGRTDLRQAVWPSTDLCSCYYQSVHSQSHSWPLSGNEMNPLCWCTALLHDSCWHPVNTRWYLRGFECRASVIINIYNLFRCSDVSTPSKWNNIHSMFREDIPSQDFSSGLSL